MDDHGLLEYSSQTTASLAQQRRRRRRRRQRLQTQRQREYSTLWRRSCKDYGCFGADKGAPSRWEGVKQSRRQSRGRWMAGRILLAICVFTVSDVLKLCEARKRRETWEDRNQRQRRLLPKDVPTDPKIQSKLSALLTYSEWEKALHTAATTVAREEEEARNGNVPSGFRRRETQQECSSPLVRWLEPLVRAMSYTKYSQLRDNNITQLTYIYKRFIAEPGNGTDEYLGAKGEYTDELKHQHHRSQNFWRDVSVDDGEMELTGVRLVGMHGRDLADPKILVATLKFMKPGLESEAEYENMAWVVQSIIESIPWGYDNPVLSFNAMASPEEEGDPDDESEGSSADSSGFRPASIILGDGMLQFMYDTGFGMHGPDFIHAHEFAHHLQFAVPGFVFQRGEQFQLGEMRRLELMADVVGSYFLVRTMGAAHPDIGSHVGNIAFAIGDCNVDHKTHHGTPTQRKCAATWAAHMARGTQVMPAEMLFNLVDEMLDRILTLDPTLCEADAFASPSDVVPFHTPTFAPTNAASATGKPSTPTPTASSPTTATPTTLRPATTTPTSSQPTKLTPSAPPNTAPTPPQSLRPTFDVSNPSLKTPTLLPTTATFTMPIKPTAPPRPSFKQQSQSPTSTGAMFSDVLATPPPTALLESYYGRFTFPTGSPMKKVKQRAPERGDEDNALPPRRSLPPLLTTPSPSDSSETNAPTGTPVPTYGAVVLSSPRAEATTTLAPSAEPSLLPSSVPTSSPSAVVVDDSSPSLVDDSASAEAFKSTASDASSWLRVPLTSVGGVCLGVVLWALCW